MNRPSFASTFKNEHVVPAMATNVKPKEAKIAAASAGNR
jgi:hypothetical protein